jgi:hypothetical protein
MEFEYFRLSKTQMRKARKEETMTSIRYEQLQPATPAITVPSKLVAAVAALVLIGVVSLLGINIKPAEPDYPGNSGSIAVLK